jgi:hypothetical protein
MTLDVFLATSLVKVAAEATPLLAQPPRPPVPVYDLPTPNPTPGVGLAESLGMGMPWKGALIGGLGLGAYKYLTAKKGDRLRDTMKGAITGVLGGAGTELGAGLGGELARRHARYGEGTPMETTGIAAGGTAAGAGLGLGSAYLLNKFLSRDSSEDE